MSDRVSVEDLKLAATWLALNEGPDGEAEGCLRVAEYLEREIARREAEALARAVSAKVGRRVTPTQVLAATERLAAKREGGK